MGACVTPRTNWQMKVLGHCSCHLGCHGAGSPHTLVGQLRPKSLLASIPVPGWSERRGQGGSQTDPENRLRLPLWLRLPLRSAFLRGGLRGVWCCLSVVLYTPATAAYPTPCRPGQGAHGPVPFTVGASEGRGGSAASPRDTATLKTPSKPLRLRALVSPSVKWDVTIPFLLNGQGERSC